MKRECSHVEKLFLANLPHAPALSCLLFPSHQGTKHLPFVLVDIHAAVELLQLLLQQLQVGVDVAQLQGNRLLHLVVTGGSAGQHSMDQTSP